MIRKTVRDAVPGRWSEVICVLARNQVTVCKPLPAVHNRAADVDGLQPHGFPFCLKAEMEEEGGAGGPGCTSTDSEIGARQIQKTSLPGRACVAWEHFSPLPRKPQPRPIGPQPSGPAFQARESPGFREESGLAGSRTQVYEEPTLRLGGSFPSGRPLGPESVCHRSYTRSCILFSDDRVTRSRARRLSTIARPSPALAEFRRELRQLCFQPGADFRERAGGRHGSLTESGPGPVLEHPAWTVVKPIPSILAESACFSRNTATADTTRAPLPVGGGALGCFG
jgi:hypothetical protein